jgi:hypothetical protein
VGIAETLRRSGLELGCLVGSVVNHEVMSKPGREINLGTSLAGTRLLARRHPAYRGRERDLLRLYGTWEGPPSGGLADRLVVAVKPRLGAVGVERRGWAVRDSLLDQPVLGGVS